MASQNIDELLEIARLIHRQRTGSLDTGERRILQDWLNEDAANRALYEEIARDGFVPEMLESMDTDALRAAAGQVYQALGMASGKTAVRGIQRLYRWTAAAAIILLVTGGFLLFRHSGKTASEREPTQAAVADVAAPRGSRTTLTLGNGQTIVLDSAQTGTLSEQGGAKVSKTGAGQLSYSVGKGGLAAIVQNTLSTARGGQTSVTLADGTRVWLNALSSLRYPAAFTGPTRDVELSGEAYFEVAHHIGRPFRVHSGRSVIEDIGTRFDVNGYADEPAIRTALLEGMVSVDKRVLHPGEEAAVDKDGHLTVGKNIDEDQILAWKNGFFEFNRSDLGTILRQVSRWYDVDIDYSHIPLSHRTFSGAVSRQSNLSEVLKILQQANIRFRIEGRKIMLLP